MKTSLLRVPTFLCVLSSAVITPAFSPWQASAQYDILTFDPASTGPWSQPGKTTLVVPKVANGSVTLDGTVSSAEYGGFLGITVTPGNADGTVGNAWILDFPAERSWNNAADSSFTFYLAHDDDYFYVGADVKDDIVNRDDFNTSFYWLDDCIEIVVDALNNRTTDNTDSSHDAFGGHNHVSFDGRFSTWADTLTNTALTSFCTGTSWTYGADATNDAFGFGMAVTGGWKMEMRYKKSMFEDPAAGNKLRNGSIMGFNIALDDDDKKGPGLNGNNTQPLDLDVQYIWANRPYYAGYTAAYLAGLTAEQKSAQVWRTDLAPLIQDGGGRNSHAVTGEIIFGYDANLKSSGNILWVGVNAVSPINADAYLIALLQAKGYTVTVVAAPLPTPDDLRAAAVGQNLVIISESLGSTSILEPIGDPVVQKFILRDTDIPVISYEAFMWDNSEWTDHPADFSNEFSYFGNTGRTETTQPPELAVALDSLYIQLPSHPIAAGLTGKVKVFDLPYSLNYGKPSADAKVIASATTNGTYPTLFVYEKGDKLVDGSVVPNKRIGLFLGQAASLTANWAPDSATLSADGRKLFLNTVAYALVTPAPTLSIARNGNNVVVTYANGTLQSVGALPATATAWKDETGASPFTITSPATNLFFRVKGN